MFEFKQDLDIILKTLNITSADICRELGFDMPTVSNWLNGKFEPDRRSKEDIYSYAYAKGLNINSAYENPLSDLMNKQKCELLYHGSKQGITGEIDINKSSEYNDFGKGFYLGETLEQSSTFVSLYDESIVYSYGLFSNKLKTYTFDNDNDWIITIAYNRHQLQKYKDSKKLKKIIDKTKDVDVIIAPIADNRMMEIIREFAEGNITDKACCYALNAMNLGKQYVLKTDKAINALDFVKEYYECHQEKIDYETLRRKRQNERYEAIKDFRNKYRNKGKYIDQII